MKRDPAPHSDAVPPWPAPYAYTNERLWLDCLLEREILRLRARYELSLDELRGLYISDRQVDELLCRHAEQLRPAGADEHDPVQVLTRQAAQWRAHFAADSPPALLAQRLSLSERDLELVLIALAPELDLRYETLYAYLNNDIGRKTATPDMARRLLDEDSIGVVIDGTRDDNSTRDCVVRLLGMGILKSPDADALRSSLCCGLVLPRVLVHFLLGLAPSDQNTSPCGCASGAVLEAIADATAIPPVHGELLICRGDDEEGLAAWTTRLLTARRCHGLHLTSETLLSDQEVTLQARLTGAALVLHDAAEAIRDNATAERLARMLRQLCRDGHQLICLMPRDWQPDAHFGRLPATTIDLPDCSLTERTAAWSEALRQSASGDTADDEHSELANALASRFTLSGARIKLAVRSARTMCTTDIEDKDYRSALERSARRLGAGALAQVAQHATKPHRWPQLVLSSTTMQLLREIGSAIACRERVFREWNMQGRTGRSAGLMMLFAGSSGTGKTMAASVLANHVGLELYRVDLASVISKYIGETEKNLDRIFTTARDADAILLFDEADALLGKRSEVKDAHDRYANIEVAYLLQKMEEHDGVVILASNLPKNLDQAFSRRMHYVVEFSRPNAALREQLWRGMFPAEVPLATDIDYGFLGEQFDLTGGDIQTIALEAAFLAAGDGTRLGMAHLMRAIARRQTKHGDPGVAARFRTYLDTLEQGRA